MKLSFSSTRIAILLSFGVWLVKAKENLIKDDSLSEDFYPTPDDYKQNYFNVLPGEDTIYVTLEPSTVYVTITETIVEQKTESPEIKTLTFLTTKLTTNVETETEIKIFEGSYSASSTTSEIAIETTSTADTATLATTKDTPGELNLIFGNDRPNGYLHDSPTMSSLLAKELTKSGYTVVSSIADPVSGNHVIPSTLEMTSKYFERVVANSSSSEQAEDTSISIPNASSPSEEGLKITRNESDGSLSTTPDIDTKYDILEGFSPYSDLPTADFDLSNAGSSNFNLKIGTIILGAATIFFVVGTIVL